MAEEVSEPGLILLCPEFCPVQFVWCQIGTEEHPFEVPTWSRQRLKLQDQHTSFGCVALPHKKLLFFAKLRLMALSWLRV